MSFCWLWFYWKLLSVGSFSDIIVWYVWICTFVSILSHSLPPISLSFSLKNSQLQSLQMFYFISYVSLSIPYVTGFIPYLVLIVSISILCDLVCIAFWVMYQHTLFFLVLWSDFQNIMLLCLQTFRCFFNSQWIFVLIHFLILRFKTILAILNLRLNFLIVTNETNVEVMWFSNLLFSFLFSYQKKNSRLTSSKPIRKEAKHAVAWDEQWSKASLEFCSSNSVFVLSRLYGWPSLSKPIFMTCWNIASLLCFFLILITYLRTLCNIYWSYSLPCLNCSQVHLTLWEIFIRVYKVQKIRTDPWDILYWSHTSTSRSRST